MTTSKIAKPKAPRADWGTGFSNVHLPPAAQAVFRRVARRLRIEGTGSLPVGIVLTAIPGNTNPFGAGTIVHYALLMLEASLDDAKKKGT